MKHLLFLLLLLVSCPLTGCRISDPREVVIEVPGMVTEADVQRIRTALKTLNGLEHDRCELDTQKRLVKLRYDTMQLGLKNIEIVIAEAGYDANDIPAISKKANK